MRSARRHAIQPSSGVRQEDVLPVASRLTTRPPSPSPRHLQAAKRRRFLARFRFLPSARRMPFQATDAALHRERTSIPPRGIASMRTPGDPTIHGSRSRLRSNMCRTAPLDTIEPSRQRRPRHRRGPLPRCMRRHEPAGVQQDRRCSDQGTDHALQTLQHSSKNSTARVSDADHGPLAAVSPGCPPPTVEPKCHRAPSTMANRSCRNGKECLSSFVLHRTSTPPRSDRFELR